MPWNSFLPREGERVFAAAARGLRARHQDMNLGFVPVPDVIDERDLGLDIFDVAVEQSKKTRGAAFLSASMSDACGGGTVWAHRRPALW